MTNEFYSDVVKFRGKIYEIRELSAHRYNKTVKQATNVDEETKAETFDSEAHVRILLAQCVKVGTAVEKGADKRLHLTDPQSIDVEELMQEGNRVFRELSSRVLKINLDEEPEEEILELEGEASAEAVKS